MEYSIRACTSNAYFQTPEIRFDFSSGLYDISGLSSQVFGCDGYSGSTLYPVNASKVNVHLESPFTFEKGNFYSIYFTLQSSTSAICEFHFKEDVEATYLSFINGSFFSASPQTLFINEVQHSFAGTLFTGVSSVVTNFGKSVSECVSSVGSMFYANGNMTFLGTCSLLVSGVALVFWAFRMIKRLVVR